MTDKVPQEVVERVSRKTQLTSRVVLPILESLTLSDLRALAEARGYVVVPREPTEAMITAGEREVAEGETVVELDDVDDLTPDELQARLRESYREDLATEYRAMVEAAQAEEERGQR